VILTVLNLDTSHSSYANELYGILILEIELNVFRHRLSRTTSLCFIPVRQVWWRNDYTVRWIMHNVHDKSSAVTEMTAQCCTNQRV